MDARVKPAHDERPSLRRARRRKRNRLDPGKVELARRMIDIEADHVAVGVEINVETFDNLPRLRARRALQLDIEAVRLRIVMQLHGAIAEIAVEERVMDRRAIVECNRDWMLPRSDINKWMHQRFTANYALSP